MSLPWKDVNAQDAQSVAQRIKLPKPEKSERRKWGCPFCGSSDALHAYAGPGAGFGCWAACGADRPKGCRGYSIIDVASKHLDLSAAETCRRLARDFGIPYDDRRDPAPTGTAVENVPRIVPLSKQEQNLAAVKMIPGGRLPPVIYADLVRRLRLTVRGSRYLAERRLNPAAAQARGFRSVDDSRVWDTIRAYLQRTYRREELAAAGFPLEPDGNRERITLPFNGRFPALLIPFSRRGKLIGLRFRSLLPDHPDYKHNRYRNLVAAKPPWPYNADALRASVVHLTEGELDGETLCQLGENAAGSYGAGIWLDTWTLEVAHASLWISWHHADDAGDAGAHALRTKLVDAYGEAVVAERWRRVVTDADPNSLHRQGRLQRIIRCRPWQSVDDDHVMVA